MACSGASVSWTAASPLRKGWEKCAPPNPLSDTISAPPKAARQPARHPPSAAHREPVTAESFRFELDHAKLKATRRHEGQYLLPSNFTGQDPNELWRQYINLVRIKESFRTLKGDLGLRPVFHQLDNRIEAHIFISFLAYCLHVGCLSEIQMLDVTIPATDGRELRMKRYTKPEKVHQLLLTSSALLCPNSPRPKSPVQRPWWRPFAKPHAKSTIPPKKTNLTAEFR